jgi:hypothetical protein
MTNLTPERIAELQDRSTEGLNNAKEYVDLFLDGAVKDSWEKRVSFWTDLLSILSDYSKVKAENERLSPPPQASPTPKEREEMDAWLGVLNVYGGNDQVIRGHWTVEDSDMVDNLRALILAPEKKVSRAAFNLACEKFSGHWAGAVDDIRRLGENILNEIGFAVESEREEEKP